MITFVPHASDMRVAAMLDTTRARCNCRSNILSAWFYSVKVVNVSRSMHPDSLYYLFLEMRLRLRFRAGANRTSAAGAVGRSTVFFERVLQVSGAKCLLL